MLLIKRFVNELMSSNCYVLSKDGSFNCIVIDPASKDCIEIIKYMEETGLTPEYIILTHEHSDHTWGCNTLIDKYSAKTIASESCKNALPNESNAYFQFYFDDPDYTYEVKQIDFTIEDIDCQLIWGSVTMRFIPSQGHSKGSICVNIDNYLFTGDTVMNGFKPIINKRNGGSYDEFRDSLNTIFSTFPLDTVVFPGHGEMFSLGEVRGFYKDYM